MIRKVVIATINYDHAQVGMRRAFKYLFSDDNVREIDYLQLERDGKSLKEINEIFKLNVLAFNPDWVWMQLQETNIISADTLLELKSKLPKTIFTHWTGDYRPEISSYIASICRATDHTFISSVGQIPLFLEAGAKAASYLQIGLDREEDVLGIPDWTPPFEVPDVVFIGNYYGSYFPIGTEQRISTIRAIQQANINIGVVGNGWPEDINVIGNCDYKKQHHIYKRAKVAVNVNHINDVDRYYSDRQLIAMASGTPLVCWRVPGLEKEFIFNLNLPSHCITFASPEEAVQAVKYLFTYPEFASAVGQTGRTEVIRNHDWINRINAAAEIIEELRA